MKKVLAVCVAMMSLPAVADVTLYGQIKGGINVMKGEDSGTITQMEDVESTGQRNTLFQYLLWGFKVKCFSRSFI